jgi:L-threonylcarbamoyladenylate synthase
VAEIIKINQEKPEPERIARAAAAITSGGVISYPTETVYGIGCSIHHQAAIQRIYELKKRETNKPLSLIVADREQLQDIVLEISPIAEQLIQAFWPGPLTIIFQAAPTLNPILLGQGKSVGIRIPDNRICLDLLRQSATAIVSTSANLSGSPAPTTVKEVIASVGAVLDLIIDGGPTLGSVPSTVVDTTGPEPVICRVGTITENEINFIKKVDTK